MVGLRDCARLSGRKAPPQHNQSSEGNPPLSGQHSPQSSSPLLSGKVLERRGEQKIHQLFLTSPQCVHHQRIASKKDSPSCPGRESPTVENRLPLTPALTACDGKGRARGTSRDNSPSPEGSPGSLAKSIAEGFPHTRLSALPSGLWISELFSLSLGSPQNSQRPLFLSPDRKRERAV